jgi:hypothetical protein
MATTPFGMKLIYKINDECIWSEYLTTFQSAEETPHTIRLRERAEHVLFSIKRGLQFALLRRAS